MKRMNNLGIDVGKRKCRAVVLKDDKEKILDKFFFDNDKNGIQCLLLSRIQSHGKCSNRAVLESTGKMWMRIHDMLEENEIDTIYLPIHIQDKKIIAESKIKSDKLDAIEYII
jgi:transposase